MQLRKYRWSPTYEPSEFELIRLLEQRKIETKPWELEAGDTQSSGDDQPDIRLWCAEGSLILTTDDSRISLQSGDALEIPAGTAHTIIAGFTGCTCYQSPARV